MSNQLVTASVSWALPARLFGVAAKAIAVVLLARLLGPTEFGVFITILSVVATFVLFADAGLSAATARRLAEMDKPSAAPVGKAACLLLPILLLLCGLYLAVSDSLAALLESAELHELRWIVLLLAVGQIATKFSSKTYEGFRRVDLSSRLSLFLEWSSWGLALGFVFIGPSVASSALLGRATGLLLLAIVLVFGIRHVAVVQDTPPDSTTRLQLVRYAIPMMFTAAGFYIYTHSDVLLVQYFLGSEEVGVYGTVVRMLDMLHVPAAAVGSATAGFFVARKRASLAAAQSLFHKTTRGLLFFFVPAAVGVILLSEEILLFVFGAEYGAGRLVLALYAPFLVLKALSGTYSLALDYLGYATHRAIAAFLSALANLGLNVVLIPRVGIEGAAIATLATYAPLMTWYVFLLQRDLEITLPSIATYSPAILGSGIVMGIVIYASNELWDMHVFMSIVVGIITYGGVSRLTGVWDVETVRKTVSRLN